MNPREFEQRVLHLLLTSSGGLTAAGVAYHLGLSVAEAERGLDRMARKGILEVAADDEGRLTYLSGLARPQEGKSERPPVSVGEEEAWEEPWAEPRGGPLAPAEPRSAMASSEPSSSLVHCAGGGASGAARRHLGRRLALVVLAMALVAATTLIFRYFYLSRRPTMVENVMEAFGTEFPQAPYNEDVTDSLGEQNVLFLLFLPTYSPEWESSSQEVIRHNVKEAYDRVFGVHTDANDELDWEACSNAYYGPNSSAPLIPTDAESMKCSLAEHLYRLSASNPNGQRLKFRGTVVGPVQIPYDFISNFNWFKAFEGEGGTWLTGMVRTPGLMLDFLHKDSLLKQEEWHSGKVLASSADATNCGSACTYRWDAPVCVVNEDNPEGDCHSLASWIFNSGWVMDLSQEEPPFRRFLFGGYLPLPEALIPAAGGVGCGPLEGVSLSPFLSPDTVQYGAAQFFPTSGLGGGVHEVGHMIGADLPPLAVQAFMDANTEEGQPVWLPQEEESPFEEWPGHITRLTDEQGMDSDNYRRGSYYVDFLSGMGGYAASEYAAYRKIAERMVHYWECTRDVDCGPFSDFSKYYTALFSSSSRVQGVCKQTHMKADGPHGYCVQECDIDDPKCGASLACRNVRLGVPEVSDEAVYGCTTWNEPLIAVGEFPLEDVVKKETGAGDDIIDSFVNTLIRQAQSPLDYCFPPCRDTIDDVYYPELGDALCQEGYGRRGWVCANHLGDYLFGDNRLHCVPPNPDVPLASVSSWPRWCRLSMEKSAYENPGVIPVEHGWVEGPVWRWRLGGPVQASTQLSNWLATYEFGYDPSNPFHTFEDVNFQWTFFELGKRRVPDLYDAEGLSSLSLKIRKDLDVPAYEQETDEWDNEWYGGLVYFSTYLGRYGRLGQHVFSGAYTDFVGEISPFSRNGLGWFAASDVMEVVLSSMPGLCNTEHFNSHSGQYAQNVTLTPWHIQNGEPHMLRIHLVEDRSVYIDIADEPNWGEGSWSSGVPDDLFVRDPSQTHGIRAYFVDERVPVGKGVVRAIDLGDDFDDESTCTSPGFPEEDDQMIVFPRVGTLGRGTFTLSPCLGLQARAGFGENACNTEEHKCDNFPTPLRKSIFCETDQDCHIPQWNVPRKYIPGLGTYFDQNGNQLCQYPTESVPTQCPKPGSIGAWGTTNRYGPFECGQPTTCSSNDWEHCACTAHELYSNAYLYGPGTYPRGEDDWYSVKFPENFDLSESNGMKCLGFKLSVDCDEAPRCTIISIQVRYFASLDKGGKGAAPARSGPDLYGQPGLPFKAPASP